jgi:hypothetical protein
MLSLGEPVFPRFHRRMPSAHTPSPSVHGDSFRQIEHCLCTTLLSDFRPQRVTTACIGHEYYDVRVPPRCCRRHNRHGGSRTWRSVIAARSGPVGTAHSSPSDPDDSLHASTAPDARGMNNTRVAGSASMNRSRPSPWSVRMHTQSPPNAFGHLPGASSRSK